MQLPFFSFMLILRCYCVLCAAKPRNGEKLVVRVKCALVPSNETRRRGRQEEGKIDTSAPRCGAVNAYYACETISPIKIAITYFRDR